MSPTNLFPTAHISAMLRSLSSATLSVATIVADQQPLPNVGQPLPNATQPLPNATCRLTISRCSPASSTIRGRPRREATTGINTAEAKGKVCTLANTANQVATETGVSARTVRNYAKLAEKVEEIQAAQPEAPRAEVVAKAKGAVMKDNLTKPKKKKAEVKLPAGCAEVGTSFKSMISEASDDMFQWMLDCISAEKKNRKARSNT